MGSEYAYSDPIYPTDKRLHAYPGRRSDDGPQALESSAAFLHRYLR